MQWSYQPEINRNTEIFALYDDTDVVKRNENWLEIIANKKQMLADKLAEEENEHPYHPDIYSSMKALSKLKKLNPDKIYEHLNFTSIEKFIGR